MDEKQSIQEQLLFEQAKKWLIENGEFKIRPYKQKDLFQGVFKDKNGTIKETGEDVKRLTIQIYNDVKY